MTENELNRYEKLFIAATRISADMELLLEIMENRPIPLENRLSKRFQENLENLRDSLIGSSEDPHMENHLPSLEDL